MSPSQGELIFAYGSLIWRPGFQYVRRWQAELRGYAREFWQGSIDHRGTPEYPGRVVTLVPDESARCWGLVYEIEPLAVEQIVAELDIREQGGYEQARVTVYDQIGQGHDALTYIADDQNPNFLGAAREAEVLEQIATAVGPSGANVDYVLELAASLTTFEIEAPEVTTLAAALIQRANQDA